jgi:hypothetical protein
VRDYALELEVLRLAEEVNSRTHNGETSGSFERRLFSRLDQGDVDYGDAYLSRDSSDDDNLREAAQEPLDAAAWSLLELQRLRPLISSDDWEEYQMATVAATAAAIHCDIAITYLMQLRREALE